MLRCLICILALAASCRGEDTATASTGVANGYPTPEERIGELEARVQRLEVQVALLQGKIVVKDGLYQVRAGDTGSKIAIMFGITLVDLATLNPDQAWAHLKIGQFVRIEPKKVPNQHLSTTAQAKSGDGETSSQR